MSISVTELVALVPGKERFNALLSKIGWPIIALPRANGNIGQLKATTIATVRVIAVASLKVTNYELTTCAMIRVMRKGLHGKNWPSQVGIRCDPSIVRRELGKVSNQRFHRVFCSVPRHDGTFGNKYSLLVLTHVVPVKS